MIEGLNPRVRCPACGTDQDAPRTAHLASCVICATPLRPFSAAASGNGAREDTVRSNNHGSHPSATFELSEDSPFARAAAALPSQAEASTMQALEIDEILEAEKRGTSLFALIPLWGAWRIWRSEIHELPEKLRLVALSILLTLSLTFAVWVSLPSAEQRFLTVQTQTENRILALADLVRAYKHQYGSLPDEDTWQRSALRSDLRFFDPWGHIFAYRREPRGFTIGTYGKDGLHGGPGEEQDFFRTFSDAEEIIPSP